MTSRQGMSFPLTALTSLFQLKTSKRKEINEERRQRTMKPKARTKTVKLSVVNTNQRIIRIVWRIIPRRAADIIESAY
ncbi:hypothetical protein J6590_061884 [Homalodisca vitripennis]|nr:hypothetical protein J6590_061884 [Homalodisca vitripennis]